MLIKKHAEFFHYHILWPIKMVIIAVMQRINILFRVQPITLIGCLWPMYQVWNLSHQWPTNQLYFRSGICSHQQNLLCVSQTTGVRVDVAAPTLHPQLSLFPNQFNKIHFFIIFIFQSKGVDCMGLWCLWLMPYMLESLSTSVISHGYWNTKWQLIIYEMSRKYPRLKSI